MIGPLLLVLLLLLMLLNLLVILALLLLLLGNLWPSQRKVARPTQQHLLQQTVDLGHADRLCELNQLDHLLGDALQVGQKKQNLTEATTRVILVVIYIVLQTRLDLMAQVLDARTVAQAFGN